jgi:hypothetical protein
MASMVATNAFVPVLALHHHSSSRHHYATLATTVPSRKTSSLKTVENPDDNNEDYDKTSSKHKNAEETIPRGGGINVADDKPPALPTLADYRKFAIPCLALWVAQPLLSLVDTAFVGLSAGSASAAQLAALGPATTFFDGATYLFAFLNVATTNLYSTARAQKGEQSDQAEAVVRTASRVAVRCGVGIMLFLLAFARPLLGLYIGRSFILIF